MTFAALEPLPEPRSGDLVIVPGLRLEPPVLGQAWFPENLLTWLRTAHIAGAHLASVCTGAVLLAEAGLLEGRRCTTHWELIQMMRDRYPRALVQDAVLYTHDGTVTTSAGIASGIDMALSLLEIQHGPLLAARVARYMVVYLRREGSQHQVSVYLSYRTHLHPGVHRVQDHLIQHAAIKTDLTALSTLANLSPRSLSNAFVRHTGLTPLAYQHKLRLELAGQLLNNPRLTVDAIAAQCGYEDPRHFRRVWHSAHGVTPSVWREKTAMVG